MKKTINLFKAILLAILFILYSGVYKGKTQENSKINTDQIIAEINSHDIEIQKKAILKIITMTNEDFQVKDEYRAPEIKDALFHLLEKWSISPPGGWVIFGDMDNIYCLLQLEGGLQEVRAIPYLINNINLGWGISESLIKIGEPSIEPLLDVLENGTDWDRSRAALTLGEMLKVKEKYYTPHDKIRQKIKNSLIKALKDEKNQYPIDKTIKRYLQKMNEVIFVKKGLIRAIGDLGDTDVIPLIKSVAENDLYSEFIDASTLGGKKGQKITIYPVREAAKKVLEELKAKEKGK